MTFSGGVLSFAYAPEAGDPAIHYFGVFQGGAGGPLGPCDCNNTYQLFYSANPLTSGSITMSDYFHNSDSWSHIDFFDTGGSPVPEPATWAMMLLGFAGIGWSMRRAQSHKAALA